MKVWIDAQLSPTIADWLHSQFGIECVALRDLGLRQAIDSQIYCLQNVYGREISH